MPEWIKADAFFMYQSVIDPHTKKWGKVKIWLIVEVVK
jgi:hypothetical protein